MEILVFKTSVSNLQSVKELSPQLDSLAGKGMWNFALDDCDKILRIRADRDEIPMAVRILNSQGFMCSELED